MAAPTLADLTETDQVVLKTVLTWLEHGIGAPLGSDNIGEAFKQATARKVGNWTNMSPASVTSFVQDSDTFTGKNAGLLVYLRLYMAALETSGDPWPGVAPSDKWAPREAPSDTPPPPQTTGAAEPAPEQVPDPVMVPLRTPGEEIDRLISKHAYGPASTTWWVYTPTNMVLRMGHGMGTGKLDHIGPFVNETVANQAAEILRNSGTGTTPPPTEAPPRQWYVLDDGTPVHVDAQGLENLTATGRVTMGPFPTEEAATTYYNQETTDGAPAAAEPAPEAPPADPLDAVEAHLEAAVDRQRQATGRSGDWLESSPGTAGGSAPSGVTSRGGKTSTERSRESRERKRAGVQAQHGTKRFKGSAQEVATLRQWIVDNHEGEAIRDESDLVAGIIAHYLVMGNSRASHAWMADWSGESLDRLKAKVKAATFVRGKHWDAYVSEIIPHGSPLENIDTDGIEDNLEAMRHRLEEAQGRLREEFASVVVEEEEPTLAEVARANADQEAAAGFWYVGWTNHDMNVFMEDAPLADDRLGGACSITGPFTSEADARTAGQAMEKDNAAGMDGIKARLEATERDAKEAHAALEAMEARLVQYQARDRLEGCILDGCLLAVDPGAGLYATPEPKTGNPIIQKVKEGQLSFHVTERLDLSIGNTTSTDAPNLGPTVEIRERLPDKKKPKGNKP